MAKLKNTLLQQMPQHTAQLPMSWHDIGQKTSFTSSTGHLLPVFSQFMNAGESIQGKSLLFARSTPLIADPMCDVEIKIDHFFVPMQMIYTLFGDVRYNVDDRLSDFYQKSKLSLAQQGKFPKAYWNSLSNELNEDAAFAAYSDLLGNTDWQSAISELGVGYSDYFDCRGKELYRLLWHLGYNPNLLFAHIAGTSDEETEYLQSISQFPLIFPYKALAYQAIYQKYYRIEDREPYDPTSFNVDSSYNSEYISNTGSIYRKIFQLRYRPRLQDYFTRVKISPLASAVSLLGTSGYGGYGLVSRIRSAADDNLVDYSGSLDGVTDVEHSVKLPNVSEYVFSRQATSISNDNNTYLSAQNIRQLFAVDKLVRVTGRAGKNYDDQVLAHFGFKVPQDVKHNISYLGTDSGVVSFQQVTSTAGTDQAVLGEIAGQGFINIDGHTVKFQAPVDGVYMQIYSAVPHVAYDAPFEKDNLVTDRNSLYIPEFDRLGMQPMFASEVSYAGMMQDYAAARIGWQFNYEHWKSKFNRVSPAFKVPRNNAEGSANLYSSWLLCKYPFAFSYITESGDVVGTEIPYWNFLSSPEDLNTIMQVPYSTEWSTDYYSRPWLMFQTDPFICQLSVEMHLKSVMSKTGEPILD